MIDIEGVEEVLQALIANDRENRAFSSGGEIEDANLLPSLEVPGIGEIGIPISTKDIKTLKSCGSEFLDRCKNVKSVSKCWQIDVSAVYGKRTRAGRLFQKTVATLVVNRLNQLKNETQDMGSVDIQPRRVIIYDSGCSYDKVQDEEFDPAVFAFMHLQIPVKKGYGGGSFEIIHGNQPKIYDLSANSRASYYAVVFYSDCFHRMLPITGGSKVVLLCTLAWKQPRPVFAAIHDHDGYLSAVRSELAAALANWQVPGDHHPRKLAIPLEHQYTIASLSFTYLRGRDRLTACLFRSIEFIDLHLAIIGHVTDDESGDSKAAVSHHSRKRRRTKQQAECDEVPPVMRSNEEIIAEYWVSARTDAAIPFTDLKIDGSDEVAKVNKKSESKDGVPLECLNSGPLRQKRYYNAVLVIWPNYKTIDFACRHGFIGALDILELLHKEMAKNKLLFLLGEVVAFCCSRARYVWCNSLAKDGEVTYRLLQLCIHLSNVEQGLIILDLLSRNFPEEASCNGQASNAKTFEGIPTKEVAGILAQFIRLAGWDVCSEFIHKIIAVERLALQMEPVIRFVSSLLDYRLLQPAKEVADHLCTFVFTSFPASQMNSQMNEAFGEMMFRLKEFDDSLLRTEAYINWLNNLETQLLCELIVYLIRFLAPLIKRAPSAKVLYVDVCGILVGRRFHGEILKPVTEKPLLADVLQCLLWPKNVHLVRTFIHQVIQPTIGNNQALEDLVTSRFVWNMCLTSLNGKRILTALAEARLRELSQLEPPVFSWKMSEAVVPNEPELESFLRSSDYITTLPHKFETIEDAHFWAINIFSSTFETLPSPDSNVFRYRRYSAVPKFKKVPGGFVCEVTKHKRLHEYNVRQYPIKMSEKDVLMEFYCSKLSDVQERSLSDLELDQFTNSKHVTFENQ